MKRPILQLVVMVLSTIVANTGNLTLDYDRPAKYFEETLVIGNGRIGAAIYSGADCDRLSLNDITLWTGEPDRTVVNPEAYKTIPLIRDALDRGDYGAADSLQYKVQGHYSENYQPLGNLVINYLGTHDGATDYHRSLDISRAVALAEYNVNGHRFSCEYFATAPDSAIVVRLRTDSPDGNHAIVSFTSLLPHSTTASADGSITADGYAAYKSLPTYISKKSHLYDPNRGIHFRTIINVKAIDGGDVTAHPSGEIELKGCREAVIMLTNATSFNGHDKDPVKEGRDYRNIATRRMDNCMSKDYTDLLDRHIADYSRLFNRVTLDLGKTTSDIKALSTDVQLREYTDSRHNNPELETLYFQYGRYLLISCSRTNGVPANLQGLWNESLTPPWSCNYTTNINLEENYWGALTSNLAEMQRPLLGFIDNLRAGGKETAKAYYGVNDGWCLGHNTDIWAMTCPVGSGTGHPSWANWNMGGAWVTTHVWEHYLFTRDSEQLKQSYPALRGAAEFCLGWLVERDGKLITSPSTSPENIYRTPDGYEGATLAGGTADVAMIRQCLMDTRQAASELGVDRDLTARINATLPRLSPYKVGAKGNLQEWPKDWDDQDPQHRHQSHLFGLYPGHHISVKSTPELAKACARTLEIKGDKTTGWSTGWRINLYARLGDAKKAYQTYRTLLRYVTPYDYREKDARRGGGTYPNLLDAHSPFQIDGNFGGSAGVIEMLMQSTPDTITLLPALPVEWRTGSVKGICTRTGHTVDMSWKDGRVTSLTLTARTSGKTSVTVNGKTINVKLRQGQSKKIL